MISEAKIIEKKRHIKLIERIKIQKDINKYEKFLKSSKEELNSIYDEVLSFNYYTLCFASLISNNDIYFQNHLLETLYKNDFINKDIIDTAFNHAMSYWLEYKENLLNIEYLTNNINIKNKILRKMDKLKHNFLEDYEDFSESIFPTFENIIRGYFLSINNNPKLEGKGSLPVLIDKVVKDNKIDKENDNYYKVNLLKSIVVYLYNGDNRKNGVEYGLNLRNNSAHGRFEELDIAYTKSLFITVLIVLNTLSKAEVKISN